MADEPWLKYQAAAASPASDGPWSKYQTTTPTTQKDDLPWDVPMTGAQMRAEQAKTTEADKTLDAVSPAPGFMHMLASPFLGAAKAGQAMLGERAPLAPTEMLGAAVAGAEPFGGGVGTAATMAGDLGAVGQWARERAAPHPWTPEMVEQAAKDLGAPTAAKAQKIVERRINQVSPTTAQGAIDTLNAAREAGKPMMLPDVFPSAEKLAGRMARTPGQSGEILPEAFRSRNTRAVERLTGDIKRDVGADSAYQLFDDLKGARSTAAKPLFIKAMAGGSVAPLETQFEKAFSEASATESAAQRDLNNALSVKQTGAAARASQAGDNVYANAGARLGAKAADAAENDARARLEAATATKNQVRERLQQAQADRTANAPGAVWSPRLQEFLDNPRIMEGIKRGWRIERDEALAEGRPVNPGEYAVTGVTEEGDPIIGRVPTMKLLAVAKEGIDRMLQSPQYRNELTGELNKEGVAIAKVQREYLAELDRLNPEYKAARDQWSGDTSSMVALKAGQDALKNKPEINARMAADMTESEREFAKLGLAQTLREVAGDKGPLAGEFNTVAGTQYGAEGNRARIAPFFSDEASLDRFVKSVEWEQTMARTPQRVTGGSQTAGRMAEDTSPITVGDAIHGASAVALGHPMSLAHRAINLGLKAWDSRNPALNAEIARLLGNTENTIARDAQGRLVIVRPPPETPPP